MGLPRHGAARQDRSTPNGELAARRQRKVNADGVRTGIFEVIKMNIDHLITAFDRALNALFAPARSARQSPAATVEEAPLTPEQKAKSIALLRVDHSGEICAQALYQGQAWTSGSAPLREKLAAAAQEEIEHLAWCEQRIVELGGRKSFLNPLWYTGSFVIGAIAGVRGDRWNLGFLVETERQVERHLAGHINRLPVADLKSRILLDQMRYDEAKHAEMAQAEGAAHLPWPVRAGMRTASKVMTTLAYWV